MPNTFAYFVLLSWPLVVGWLFAKRPAHEALIWSLLGAYLLLPPPPAAFDFPLMPPLTKESLPSVATFLICLAVCGRRAPLLPEGWLARGLVLIFVFCPVATVLTNMEPVFFGSVGLPGLGLKDMVAQVLVW